MVTWPLLHSLINLSRSVPLLLLPILSRFAAAFASAEASPFSCPPRFQLSIPHQATTSSEAPHHTTAPTPHALRNFRNRRRRDTSSNAPRDMGEYCASPDGDAAALTALPSPSASPPPPPPTALSTTERPPYGSCDRRYMKQVFDNLHGSISLDPVRCSFLPRRPSSFTSKRWMYEWI